MSIESSDDLLTLSVEELYAVYLAIAEQDHIWRMQSLYGGALPPQVHSLPRALERDEFEQRISKARTFVGGELMLRQRLARQASAYNVDVRAVISQYRQVAEIG